MSVKIMGLVWDLDNQVIKREEKYILLAYADHADHKGRNIYPSVDLIRQKTGYSERAVQLITRKLAKKGYLVDDGQGPKGTNKWGIPLDEGGAKIAPVQKTTKGVQKRAKRGAKAIAPESSEPALEPSEGQPLDFENMTVSEARKLPSIRLFTRAANFFPGAILWEFVHKTVTENRLTYEKIHSAAVAWVGRSYSPRNVQGILEWAITGIPPVPVNGYKSQGNGGGNGRLPTSVPEVKDIPMLDPEKVREAKERFHAGLQGK